jgi:glutathione S-transferase
MILHSMIRLLVGSNAKRRGVSATACTLCLSTSSSNTSQDLYRLFYFDTRGAAELTRYLLAVAQAPYQDVRYPLKVRAVGFGVDDNYLRDQKAGHFDCNMGRLPILQVLDDVESVQPPRVVATLGQSHSINRFLAERHGLFGRSLLERAPIDAIYESCRDIRSSYLQSKHQNTKVEWIAQDLPRFCRKLETSLPPNHVPSAPWLVGNQISLADVAVYSLLGTQTSIMTGSILSTFDAVTNAECILQAYQDCPRVKACIKVVGEQSSVQQWERRRPDTFS